MMGCFFCFPGDCSFLCRRDDYALDTMPERLPVIWPESRFPGRFPGIHPGVCLCRPDGLGNSDRLGKGVATAPIPVPG